MSQKSIEAKKPAVKTIAVPLYTTMTLNKNLELTQDFAQFKVLQLQIVPATKLSHFSKNGLTLPVLAYDDLKCLSFTLNEDKDKPKFVDIAASTFAGNVVAPKARFNCDAVIWFAKSFIRCNTPISQNSYLLLEFTYEPE